MAAPYPTMIEAQADFALNLVRNDAFNSSTILSPLSISIALAMVYLGAKENTAAQIRQTIAKDAREEEIHAHFSSVLNLVNSNSLNVTLESANRVYFQNDLELVDSYVEGIQKYYGGEFEKVDFAQSFAAADKINSFVANKTHDKIQDLVKSDSFDDQTKLLLINAIYFKGQWNTLFKEENTIDADFYSLPDNTKQVKMMSLQASFLYYETDDCQVLALPYKNQQVSMHIILPKERFGLENVVRNFNASSLIQILGSKFPRNVKVQLPQFKIESSFNLTDALIKLGITDAFGDYSNFSGIDGKQDLYISDVLHKAFIEVAEDGTTAAAATAVYNRNKILNIPMEFTADHPFMFIIADNAQRIYFIGRHHG